MRSDPCCDTSLKSPKKRVLKVSNGNMETSWTGKHGHVGSGLMQGVIQEADHKACQQCQPHSAVDKRALLGYGAALQHSHEQQCIKGIAVHVMAHQVVLGKVHAICCGKDGQQLQLSALVV